MVVGRYTWLGTYKEEALMNEKLHLGEKGKKLVQHFESCLKKVGEGKFKAYLDPVNVLTICWGHTNHHGRKITKESVWTQKECDDEFASDMIIFEKDVKKYVKVELNQNQFDALVSFTYNCGAGNLKKSTLLKKVNAEDFAGAAKEFAKWNKAGGKVLKGLTRRRKAEAELFLEKPDEGDDQLSD